MPAIGASVLPCLQSGGIHASESRGIRHCCGAALAARAIDAGEQPLRHQKESSLMVSAIRVCPLSAPARKQGWPDLQKIFELSHRQGLTRPANGRRFLLRRNEADEL